MTELHACILQIYAITYLSTKYFAKCATKLFRNMNAIEGLVTIES